MRAGAIPATPVRPPSPARALLVTALAIFGAEAVIMLLLEALPLPPRAETVLDATLLFCVMLPVLYAVWFRPLRRQMSEHAKATLANESLALTDVLTGLPNRAGFVELIAKETQHAARVHGAFALVVLDVRSFGEVNGALGRESGDQLLKNLAERLGSNAAALGVAARLGSDVFGVLLSGVDCARAGAATERLHHLVEIPFSLDGAPIEVGVRTGFAVYPNHGEHPDLLLQRAELALLNAKRAGDRSGTYREESESRARRHLELVRLLRIGIEQGELSLVYQPKISLSDGHLAGVEALVRWTQPALGPVSPAEFVPLAEQTNLIRPLTLWVLEEAIRQIAAWRSGGMEVSVSVNLSARNLTDETLPERVRELLAAWSVEPAAVCLEVTESAVLSEPARAADVLERFRALGLTISIDDFGTGYSSLTYLRTMPATELKIDRSFVQDLEASESSGAIVQAVVGLAHSLGLKVVSEGVETEAALLRLRKLGCDQAQGHFVSPPLTARDLVEFVERSGARVFRAGGYEATSERPRLSLVPRLSRPPLRESLRAIRIASSH